MKTQQSLGLFPESPGSTLATPRLLEDTSIPTAITTIIEGQLIQADGLNSSE
jgi:hypothetical protein